MPLNLPPVSPGCVRVRVDSFDPLTGKYQGVHMSGLHDGRRVVFDISDPRESNKVASRLTGTNAVVIDLEEAGIANFQLHDGDPS